MGWFPVEIAEGTGRLGADGLRGKHHDPGTEQMTAKSRKGDITLMSLSRNKRAYVRNL
jgi:hypothetical protein